MPSRRYSKPPVTEAVIQVLLAPALTIEEVRSASQSLSHNYPGEQEYRLIDLAEIAPNTTLQLKDGLVQFRRATDDQQEVVIINPDFLLVSALAPYRGWEHLQRRFDRDWESMRKSFGYRRLTRISMRYINRIDVPTSSMPEEAPEKTFIRAWMDKPASIGACSQYALQGRFLARLPGCEISLNVAMQDSPVPEHVGFTLDIDLLRVRDVPQRPDAVLDLLEQMRQEKNRIFEDLITDEARKLFA